MRPMRQTNRKNRSTTHRIRNLHAQPRRNLPQRVNGATVVDTETPSDLREALFHASFTPHRERNHAWWEWLDDVLDQLSACNK